jgi:hypothetical protein
MRLYPRAYAALLALFAVVAIHALGQGSGEALARAPVTETAAESKHVVVPGRAQPGYLERNFRPKSTPARRDAQGGSSGKSVAIPAPAPAVSGDRLVGAMPCTAVVCAPSAPREWHQARAPPLAA